eukprot:46928-Hanusia_phi.AAC.2
MPAYSSNIALYSWLSFGDGGRIAQQYAIDRVALNHIKELTLVNSMRRSWKNLQRALHHIQPSVRGLPSPCVIHDHDRLIACPASQGSAKACGKLWAGDMIHKVDGRAVVSLTASEVTALIVGPPGSSVCFQISRSGLGPSDKIMFARQTREALIPRGDRETNNGRGALSSVGMTFAKVQHPGPFIVTWMDKAVSLRDIASLLSRWVQGSAYSSGLVRIGQIVHEVERRSTSLMDVEELDALLLGKPGSHVHMLLSSYVLDLNELNCIDPHVLYRSEDGDVGMEFWKGIMDGFEVLAVEPQVSSPRLCSLLTPSSRDVKGPADLARVRVGDVIHAVRDMRSGCCCLLVALMLP